MSGGGAGLCLGHEQPDEPGRPELLAKPAGRLSRRGGGPGRLGRKAFEPGLLLDQGRDCGTLLPDRLVGGVRLDLPGNLSPDPLPLCRRPGQAVTPLRGQLPGVEVGMDQRRGFELSEMIGGAAPLAEERLERDDRADRLLGEFGLVMGGLAGGDLGVDPRELAP